MKKNIKTILSSALIVVGTLGLTVGATTALFTSKSNVEVNVVAGKVNVSMNFDNLKTYSGLYNAGNDNYDLVETTTPGVFTNGGTAAIADGILKLDRISPMDKVTFDVEFTNASNINIQYRTIKEVIKDTGLFAGLDVEITKADDTTSAFVMSEYSNWTAKDAGGLLDNEKYTVSVTLPEEAGNEYQEKECEIRFGIEAVQGNAHVEDAEGADLYIYTANDLVTYGKAVNKGDVYNGKTVKLMNNINMADLIWTPVDVYGKGITFDGNKKTISNLTIADGYHGSGFFNRGNGLLIKDVIFDNAKVTGIGQVGVVVGNGICATIKGVTVKNSTIKAVVTNNDDGDKAGAIVGYLSGEPSASVKECTVENCTVEGYRDVGALVGYAGGTYEISDNLVRNCKVNNDQRNNYKGYTDPSQFDAHEVVGEKGAKGIYANNTFENVQLSYLLSQNVTAGDAGLNDMSLSAGSVQKDDGSTQPLVTVEIPTSSGDIKAGENGLGTEDSLILKVEESENPGATIVVEENEKSLNFEISLENQDGKKVTSTDSPINVKIYVGNKIVKKVYHAGSELTKDVDFTYDQTSGIITIQTKSFSPFNVVFEDYMSDEELMAAYPNATCRINNVGYDYPFPFVGKVVNVAQMTAQAYAEGKFALCHANSGDTIKILKDVEPYDTNSYQGYATNHLDVTSTVTIDLNGKKVSYPNNIELHFGTYIFTDNSDSKAGEITKGLTLSNFQSDTDAKTTTFIINGGYIRHIMHAIDKGNKNIIVNNDGRVGLIQVYCDVKQAHVEINSAAQVEYFIAENGYDVEANLTLNGCVKNKMTDQDKTTACQDFFGSTTYVGYNWYTFSN